MPHFESIGLDPTDGLRVRMFADDGTYVDESFPTPPPIEGLPPSEQLYARLLEAFIVRRMAELFGS